ncbi:HAD family hydrolase [Marinospirillum sp.]|uniref:HAD family hydrolase n=1 Tax=Marinospirillum sp. TaxID=2183934 RepID=UPI003A880F17
MDTEPPRSQPIQAILFDLDGTLVDTAPDLAQALNRLREEEGLSPLPYAAIRDQVSNGGNALIQLGFGLTSEHPDQPRLRQRLLDLYAQAPAEYSQVFPGLDQLLLQLERQPLPWGIVTNKPRLYTELVLRGLKLHPQVVVCPEDLGVSKPDPAPLLFAARQLAVAPEACVYIGDHQRDIEAGKRAGMRTLTAGFGYIPRDENPQHWQSDFIAETAAALVHWLQPRLADELTFAFG